MKNQFWAVGRWSGLDCEIKGSGPIMSNFWGPFFHFFGVKIFFKFFFENTIVSALKSCIINLKKKVEFFWIFFAPENMKKSPSKVAHNRPKFFCIFDRPKTSPNLIFCSIKISPYATFIQWLCFLPSLSYPYPCVTR